MDFQIFAESTYYNRIRASRVLLTQWNRKSFGNICQRMKDINDKICTPQNGRRNATVKSEIESLKDVTNDLALKEEVFWKQRAKALWLKKGDGNTSFFHAKANERRLHKEIKHIKDNSRNEVVSLEEIQKVIVNYFSSIFTSIQPSEEAMEEVIASLGSRVTEDMNNELIRTFTTEEITQALRQMHSLKSPGSEGVEVVSKHDKYLGLPTVVGRSKREVFEGVKERVWKKLQTWSSKQLCQAGRVVLIKSVLQALPTYHGKLSVRSAYEVAKTLKWRQGVWRTAINVIHLEIKDLTKGFTIYMEGSLECTTKAGSITPTRNLSRRDMQQLFGGTEDCGACAVLVFLCALSLGTLWHALESH
ncbi:UNVERIFIED_CONTAM: hypothetical protein Sradi_1766600 [Sesamum radiatum]|uniref:Reverse transcriptase n=1 Tax=Sesamum radiatum TaxID=300843 RepID=A0AAW2TVP5_SESRA